MSADSFGTLAFALAILHTFLVKTFVAWSHRFPKGSGPYNFLHLLGEVEVVMGLWAGIFMTYFALTHGYDELVTYMSGLNFTEPAFVFVVMAICSTRPILDLAQRLILLLARLLPVRASIGFFFVVLVVGPLLGSFITEPAAMTLCALVLLDRYFTQGVSTKLKYATLGLLFVNVSVGGALTPFAAPPVLMVASKWNWDLGYMLASFGYKGALACLISTSVVTLVFAKELARVPFSSRPPDRGAVPLWIGIVHLAFLALVVISSHHVIVFMWFFLFFLGLVNVTPAHQDQMRLREGLLVAFFLSGLVVLGPPQRWWLEPIITHLDTWQLYLSTMGLTAITDNAALTYLGAQVPGLSESAKYALVSGALVGGGLTVIANAPNPAGFGILNPAFGKEGISPIGLFMSALGPTLVAGLCFWFL